jgi:predicted GNAT family N-acyltransferase
VMWPHLDPSFIQLQEDATGIHFGLFLNDKLISVVSLFISGEDAQFRKLATDQAFQGKGYGSILLNHVFQYVREKGIAKLWCNARKDKTDFYKRFAMVETSNAFEKDGVKYIEMQIVF